MTDLEYELFSDAIATFGEDNQRIVAIEELSELIKELCKDARGEECILHIAEEIADVRIMCDQLAILYGIDYHIEKFRVMKLHRLQRRIDQRKSEKETDHETHHL